MDKELKISAENALAAYNNTDANGRELLEHLFGKEIFAQDIKDKVKTFKDACRELGKRAESNEGLALLLVDYESNADNIKTKGTLAYMKLCIIAAALNEGWEPKFDGDECRYYPWFYIYTKAEYEKLDEDEKKECRVVGRSGSNAVASGGVVFAYANYASSNSITVVGSRLAFKTRELAEYCGKQFFDIWEKFLFS